MSNTTTAVKNIKSSYTLQFKMGVVDWVESNKSSVRAAAKKFGVDRKMIRNWLSNKDKLKISLLMHGPSRKKMHQGSKPLSYDLDRQVLDYYVEMKQRGVDVSDNDIRHRALVCSHFLGLTEFKATHSWLKRWKVRCTVESTVRQNPSNCSGCENKSVEAILRLASSLLSRVKPNDAVKLSGRQRSFDTNQRSLVTSQSSPSDLASNTTYEYATREHNYCKLDHSPSHPLDCSQAHQLECSTTHPEPESNSNGLLCPNYTTSSVSPEIFDIDSLLQDGGISAVDLPLGNEVEIGNTEEIIIMQTTSECHTTNPETAESAMTTSEYLFHTDAVQSHLELQLSCGNHGKSSNDSSFKRNTKKTAKKQQTKVEGQRTSSSSSDGNARSTSPPFFHSLTLDPQGDGGLLASRLLQPVFPDEPEIVYLDMQLGMLHGLH